VIGCAELSHKNYQVSSFAEDGWSHVLQLTNHIFALPSLFLGCTPSEVVFSVQSGTDKTW
jgi:hypothetical protein